MPVEIFWNEATPPTTEADHAGAEWLAVIGSRAGLTSVMPDTVAEWLWRFSFLQVMSGRRWSDYRSEVDALAVVLDRFYSATIWTRGGPQSRDEFVSEYVAAKVDSAREQADGAVADYEKPECDMPPGRYWVGDPCYVLDRTDFHDLPESDGVHTLPNGRKVARFGTIHGDGTYQDDRGNRYAVDSGTIGCILATEIHKPEAWTDGGAFVVSQTRFVPRRTTSLVAGKAGRLHIAGVQIELDGIEFSSDG